MKIDIGISRPHYHPGKDFDMKVTKKRDLSIPPNWVANERVEHEGKSYAIVMPPRDQELWEDRQEPHIHFPEVLSVFINGVTFHTKVKVGKGFFKPEIHFDDTDAELYGIKAGDKALL